MGAVEATAATKMDYLKILVLGVFILHTRGQGVQKCCETKFHGGATFLLKAGEQALPQCRDDCVYEKEGEPRSRFCFKDGGEMSATCGISSKSETTDILMKLDDLETFVRQKMNAFECASLNSVSEKLSKKEQMLKFTQMTMVKAQSQFFRELSYEEKEMYSVVAQENGDANLPSHCPLDKLIQCNENKMVIDKCFDTSISYSNISTCLNPSCPGCACALASFLGFDCNTLEMTRFLAKTNDSSDFSFVNVLSTPYAIKEDHHESSFHLYIDGNGRLTNLDHENISFKLDDHTTYWEEKLGRKIIDRDRIAAAAIPGMAKTMVETADKLIDIIGKTKTLILEDINENIKKINLKIQGITDEAREEVFGALNLLYTSEVKVQKTRALLESLAVDTVHRVDEMLHYLPKVKDNWPATTISKFMHFQAKKMTVLVERSLALIKDAEELYGETQTNLANIQARLENFDTFMLRLIDENSVGHQKEINAIRQDVYIPCCICPICCAVCALTLEIEIGKWGRQLQALNAVIRENKERVTSIANEAKSQRDRLGREVVNLINWSVTLHGMSDMDWTFEEAEIFGFADVRPELVNKLGNLRKAAQDYLAINANQ